MMNGSLQMGSSSLYLPISNNFDYEQYEEDDQDDPISPTHSSTSSSSSSSSFSEDNDEILSSPTSPPRSPSPPHIYIYDEDCENLNNISFDTSSNNDADYAAYTISNLNSTPYYEIPSKQSQTLSYNSFDANPICPDGRHEKTPWCDSYLCDNSPGAPMWKSPMSDNDDDDHKGATVEEEQDADKENWMEEEILWRMVRKPRALKSFYVRWAMRQNSRWDKEQMGMKERRMIAQKRWRQRVLKGKKKWEMARVGRRSLLGF